MESISEDEANDYASNFVKRLQNSLVNQAQSGKTATVTNDRNGSHTVGLEFIGNDSQGPSGNRAKWTHEQTDTLKKGPRSCIKQESSAGNVKHKSRGQSLVCDSPNSPSFPTDIRAFSGISEKSLVSNQEFGSQTCKSSPRVDLESLRKKRLEFFQVVDKDSSVRNSSQSMGCSEDINNTETSGGNSDRNGGCMTSVDDERKRCGNTSTDQSITLKAVDNSSFPSGNHTSANLECLEHEDDNLRLEFWGLTEAVQSGQVNLDHYLWQQKLPTKPKQFASDNDFDHVSPVPVLKLESDNHHVMKGGKQTKMSPSVKSKKQGGAKHISSRGAKKSPRSGRYSPRTFLSDESCIVPVGIVAEVLPMNDYKLITTLSDKEQSETSNNSDIKETVREVTCRNGFKTFPICEGTKPDSKMSLGNNKQDLNRETNDFGTSRSGEINAFIDEKKWLQTSKQRQSQQTRRDDTQLYTKENSIENLNTKEVITSKTSEGMQSLRTVKELLIQKDLNGNEEKKLPLGVDFSSRRQSPPKIQLQAFSDLEHFSKPQIDGALYHKFDKKLSSRLNRHREIKSPSSLSLTMENLQSKNEMEYFWSNDLLSSESSPSVSEKGMVRKNGCSSPEKILAELTDFIKSGRTSNGLSPCKTESQIVNSSVESLCNGEKIFGSIIGQSLASDDEKSQGSAHKKVSKDKLVQNEVELSKDHTALFKTILNVDDTDKQTVRNYGSDLQDGFRKLSITQKHPATRQDISLRSGPLSDRTITNGVKTDKINKRRTGILAKVCPSCSEVNSKVANWCIECGLALISVKAVNLTMEQKESYEKQCQATKSLIMETLDSDKIKVESMGFSEKMMKDHQNGASKLTLSKKMVEPKESDVKHSLSEPSLENPGYMRRWEKSSIAWSSYNPRELSTVSSLPPEKPKGSSSKATKNKSRNKKNTARVDKVGSSLSQSWDNSADFDNNKSNSSVNINDASSRRPLSAFVSRSVDNLIDGCNKQRQQSATNESQCSSCGKGNSVNGVDEWLCDEGHVVKDSSEALYQSFSDDDFTPSKLKQGVSSVPMLDLTEVDSYDRILTLIRSQRDEPVPYLYLPDEILLRIFSFLSCQDIVSCARVCQQFYRISADESLWKVISIKRRNDLCDEWLASIGEKRPISLTISHCRSNLVTAKGLREMFRKCAETLQELNFSGCSGGELIGESILLHVSARCTNIQRIDASWSNVSNNGVKALVDSVQRLEMLCLNGCQALTDSSIRTVADKHGESLRILEVFGCFNISPSGIQLLGEKCQNLQTLNIGQCHRITDHAIGKLVSNMKQLQNLDLRGCKQARDSCVREITKNCPLLNTLTLANCPLITNVALAEIATRLPKISWLDMCGCKEINDLGVKQLARSCNNLKSLDLSSTHITQQGVTVLANYCSQSLESLKLSFCLHVTEPSVNQLVKHCKKLDTLHLYGCTRIRNIQSLSKINPSLNVEL